MSFNYITAASVTTASLTAGSIGVGGTLNATNVTITGNLVGGNVQITGSAGVSSLNGQVGTLNVCGGANVTVVTAGSNIVISSLGGGASAGVSEITVSGVSLSGSVNLSAGPNVTLTTVGNNVVISSLGGSVSAGVSSINGLSTDVFLAAGSGITLSSVGNTITITSSGASFGGSLSGNLDTYGNYIVDSSVGYSYVPSLATSDFWVGSTYIYEDTVGVLNIENDTYVDGDLTVGGMLNAQIGIADVDTLKVNSNLNVGFGARDPPYSESVFNVSGTSYFYIPDVSGVTVSSTYFTSTSSISIPANTGVSFRIWGGGGGNVTLGAKTFHGGGGAFVDTDIIPFSGTVNISFIPGGAIVAGSASGGQLVYVTAGGTSIWVGGGGGAGPFPTGVTSGINLTMAGGAGGATGEPGEGVRPNAGYNAAGGTLIAGGSGALSVTRTGSDGASMQGGNGNTNGGGGGGGAGYFGGGGGAFSGGGGGSTYLNNITGIIRSGNGSNAGSQDYPPGYSNYGNSGNGGLVELNTYTYLSSKALAISTYGPVAINTLSQQGALNVDGAIYCTSLIVGGQGIGPGGGTGVTSISAAGTTLSGIVGLIAGNNISITQIGDAFSITSTASGSGGVTSISAAGTTFTGIVGLTAGTDISISPFGNGYRITNTGSGSIGNWAYNVATSNVDMNGNYLTDASTGVITVDAGLVQAGKNHTILGGNVSVVQGSVAVNGGNMSVVGGALSVTASGFILPIGQFPGYINCTTHNVYQHENVTLLQLVNICNEALIFYGPTPGSGGSGFSVNYFSGTGPSVVRFSINQSGLMLSTPVYLDNSLITVNATTKALTVL